MEAIIKTLESYSKTCEKAVNEIETLGEISEETIEFLDCHFFPDTEESKHLVQLSRNSLEALAENLELKGDLTSGRNIGQINIELIKAVSEHLKDNGYYSLEESSWDVYNFCLGVRRWANTLSNTPNGRLIIDWKYNETMPRHKTCPIDSILNCKRNIEEIASRLIIDKLHDFLSDCPGKMIHFEKVTQVVNKNDYLAPERALLIFDRDKGCYYRALVTGLHENGSNKIFVFLVDENGLGIKEARNLREFSADDAAYILGITDFIRTNKDALEFEETGYNTCVRIKED